MRGRRKFEEDWMSSSVPEIGSLRPHVLVSHDEWPPPPRRIGRMRTAQFAAGIVVGMAAALLVSAWAVRTHRWPGAASFAPASAPPPAAQLCPPPPATRAPSPDVAPAPPAAAPAPEVASVAGHATEKGHKKAKSRKSLATRGGETHPNADPSLERQAAAELEGAPDPQLARSSAHGASTEASAHPTEASAHPEDQAAAELSTSLK